MKLLVVILCYKVPELTIECLRSLASEIGRVPGTKVAVCENGTGGDVPEQLRRAIEENGWSSWAELTVVYPNQGFCGGNNLVIRPALASADPPEYVLLLNADTVVQPHALDALVDFMDAHPRAAIAGSQLHWPDGTIQCSPFRFPGVISELDRGLNLGLFSKRVERWGIVVPTPKHDAPAEWVSGASMILRRSFLEQQGLLDEGLYTYFDDVDICMRAHRAGWESWYVTTSHIVHYEGSSTGIKPTVQKRRPAYWFQARRRFFLKNYGALRTLFIDGAYLIGASLRRVRYAIQRKPESDPPDFLYDSFRHSVFFTGFRIRPVENPALAGVEAKRGPVR
ncbi:MAG: glycosyltransferase family 2 protein [Isosphaeraceae bacterium]